MLEKMDANLKEMGLAKLDSQLEKMDTCLRKMEAMDLEANPEEITVRGGT
jgi:hypothetical protein